MSFIYAEIKDEAINIYSDTKLTLGNILKKSFNPNSLQALQQFGILKTINIAKNVNVSFAGNNISLANMFFENINNWANQEVEIETIINKAFEIHKNAKKDEIEFIISYVDDQDKPHICCIKNNSIDNDCFICYIGSTIVRNEFLKSKNKSVQQNLYFDTYSSLNSIINSTNDDSVGGFLIFCKYNKKLKEFVFPEKFILSNNIGFIKKGEMIPLTMLNEKGDFSYKIYESEYGLIIEFPQIDLSVLYTNKLRYEKDNQLTNFKYLMLPIKFNTSTLKVL